MKKLMLFVTVSCLIVGGAVFVKRCPISPWYNVWHDEAVVPAAAMESATSYSDALNKAKAGNTEMLLVFHATWCNPCRQMRRDTWNNSKVQKMISDYNLVVYFCDIDKERALAERYLNPTGRERWGVPSYVVVGNDEKVLRSGSGYKGPDDLMNWLR